MRNDDTLARVTYLPGVAPQEADSPEVDPPHGEAEPDVATAGWSEQQLQAEKVSMRALTRRGMSRWELGEALLARDLDPCIVEAEIDRLERVGLIDDAALAETFVRTQRERKGLGRAALSAQLRRRHVDPTAVEEALSQLDDEGERERAVQIAERRARQLGGVDHETAVRRLTGYLQRKGYASDIVRNAVLVALPRSPQTVRFR